MRRAVILVADSLGIGAADDAARFGDAGADTLGHITESVPLALPNLARLGLGLAARASAGRVPPGLEVEAEAVKGAWGYAVERSRGKDTPSGHWEMAGVPVLFDWGYFPDETPCFPAALTEALIAEAGLPGLLGDCHASGTEIIQRLGEEHIRTGKPIAYTSADSVFQIAAHETLFGLDRLYEVCRIARRLVDAYEVGRVIARPFVGEAAGAFERTGNRRDLATPPPAPTLLDRLTEAGGEVIAVGKVADIFAHSGIGREIKAVGNEALFEATVRALAEAGDRALVVTNFVDFDQLYGHRRDPVGYGRALERLDARLPELEARLQAGDLAVITADHGCDPTWKGTDHTREHVPVLAFGPDVRPRDLGRRESFADIGQSIAAHLGLGPLNHGEAF
ncbi:MAG: phosphopentomutase [Alphaproteobacteria bacterium]|jgi:phosphopentomutase|nr:phosphopentomutase [Alphaproteobacteria bacterium]